MAVKGKRKGNANERKIAKQLSIWMFDNPNVLYKHGSSGARKNVYSGDIVPEAELYDFGWKTWPFLFELKDGYKEHTPSFTRQRQLKEWLLKLINECNEKQFCPVFMWQIYRGPCILLTTEKLNINWNLITNVRRNGCFIYFFVYNFNDLLKYSFNEIITDRIKDVIY